MSWKVSTLAHRLGLKFQGPDIEISGCNTLDQAGPKDISFLANPKYSKQLSVSRAGAVILKPDQAHLAQTCILSDNPYLDFARIVKLFATPQGEFSGQSDLAFVHPEAHIDSEVTIYPFVYVGARARIESGTTLFSGVYVGEDCHIGSNCLLYPNVSLMSGTILGRSVILHAGVVIGSDGFGFAQAGLGREKIPQIGHVVIEDEVEIGANSTVDRAALGQTFICKGTKIDNLVQIGHNVHIGSDCVLVAQVGIAGSTKVGSNVILAGQVGVGGHLEIGDNCRIGAKSGVNKSLKANQDYSGYPVIEHRKFLRIATMQSKLPEIYNRLKKLEAEMEELQKHKTDKGGENE